MGGCGIVLGVGGADPGRDDAALGLAGTADAGIRSTVGDTGTYTVAKGQVTRSILAAPEGDGQSAQTTIGG